MVKLHDKYSSRRSELEGDNHLFLSVSVAHVSIRLNGVSFRISENKIERLNKKTSMHSRTIVPTVFSITAIYEIVSFIPFLWQWQATHRHLQWKKKIFNPFLQPYTIFLFNVFTRLTVHTMPQLVQQCKRKRSV